MGTTINYICKKLFFMAIAETNGYVKSETHNGITTVEFFHSQSNSLPAQLLKEIATAIS